MGRRKPLNGEMDVTEGTPKEGATVPNADQGSEEASKPHNSREPPPLPPPTPHKFG